MGGASVYFLASVLTPALEVLGVWLASIGLHGGFAGAMALIRGWPGVNVGEEAALGAAVGFLLGIPMAIGAALLLAITS